MREIETVAASPAVLKLDDFEAEPKGWKFLGEEEFPGAKVPLYPMADLALRRGWPIDRTPNPSLMSVDDVRAYAKN